MTRHMRDRGLDKEPAVRAGRGIAAAKRTTWQTTLRILFGVSAQEAGSPMVAAVGLPLLLTTGALVPLPPWSLTSGTAAVAASPP